MKILSLFDGMSCGQIALRELGIKVDTYFASEIDKHAIAQTQLNFPNTVQLGDVRGVKACNLPKIDLLIGGSPCQGFSFAGRQLNFNDPRSALFFEFVRILKEVRGINPDVKFLLENVRMERRCEAVISQQLGVRPVMINSALVSAQNRVRLYWTNIRTRTEGLFSDIYTDIPQPQDKGLLLRDILEPNAPERYYLPEKTVANMLKHKECQQDKACAVTVGGKMQRDLIEEPTCVAIRGREACLSPKRTEYGKAIRKDYEAGKIDERRKNIQQLEPRTDDKTNTLTTVQKDNLILLPAIYQRPRGENKGGVILDKTPTLTANPARAREDGSGQNVCKIGNRIRRLTPLECSRLQTIPSWYNWGCSETQTYKMLGNGWTVDVIAHILKHIK
jgi:DNA-cytosine methyltransferase